MTRRLTYLTFLLTVASVSGVVAQVTKYEVKVTTADKTDFARFKTYSWFQGHRAYDPAVDKQIVTAIDRSLAAAGLTNVAKKGDVEVEYHSLQRTDVDLKTWKADPKGGGSGKPYPVGTLVVNLLDPSTGDQLWHARIDKPIDLDPSKMEAIVNDAVASLFEQYPTRTQGKRK